MKTDIITISNKDTQMETILSEVDKLAAYKDLSAKNVLHLRLLAEEMTGMMSSITGERNGEFWIEDEEGEKGEFRLHLRVNTRMSTEKREQLLSAATSGKNESARGLMGRIRDFFDRSADEDIAAMASPLLLPGAFEHSSKPSMTWEWSMVQYEAVIASRMKQNDSAAKEAWDELEKSVVAHVADDVKVSIQGHTVEMIVIKRMN